MALPSGLRVKWTTMGRGAGHPDEGGRPGHSFGLYILVFDTTGSNILAGDR